MSGRWFFSLLGALSVAVLLWVFGPLLPALEPTLPRLVAVQAVLLAWAGANAALDWRRRTRRASLESGLDPALAAGEERDAVGRSLRDALAALRKAGRGGALLDLPIYAIIGPPGAGKTTALMNAGLRFTLGDAAPVPGVGGTRLCEWWFTEGAVLIDTAGRYTTQDSDAAVDRAGWSGFLALLKRTRPRQPLNGVLVATALPDLLGPDRDAHAAAIRARLSELEGAFGMRLPVYALLTKADLLAGFTEFFDDLDKEGRDEVWGHTFPFPAANAAASFPAAFDGLQARVASRLLPRLAAEARAERRAAIAGFPAQLATIEAPLAAFLTAAFPPGTLLRGTYLASGTQEGTPIDRLTGAMARAFGMQTARQAALRPESGRSYFLGRLLREVVFGEAALVREKPGARRRRVAVRGAAFAAIGLLTAGAIGFTVWSGAEAGRAVEGAEAATAGYERLVAPVASAGPVGDGDLLPLLPALDAARAGTAMPAEAAAPLGLDQAGKLRAGAAALYRDALHNALLPRLLWRLEAELRGAMADPDALYGLTATYLMLGSAGPLDPVQVRAWFAAELTRMPDLDEAASAALRAHLDRLLAAPLPQVALDGALVAAARARFAGITPAARALRQIAAEATLPPWRPADPLGLAGVTMFARASGLPMTAGIPGLYTAAGYRDVLLPALPGAARRVAAESWVTGTAVQFTPPELLALQAAVTDLWTAEFTRRWDAMLADLVVAPIGSIGQAAQTLYIMASPESPLRALLRSLAGALAVPGPAGARFAPLAALLAGDGAALERSLRLVAEMQQPLAKIAALPLGNALPPGGEDLGTALLADAPRQPEPLRRWLTNVAATATALRTGNSRRRLALAFNGPGGPAALCAAAAAQYPIAPGGSPIGAAEFTRLFGPGGALDGFLNTELKPFVDTSVRPWKLQPAGPVQPPLGAADLLQFARAATIRDAFFATGAAGPGFAVSLAAVPPPRPATLTLGATVIDSSAEPRPAEFNWPPATGPADVALAAPGLNVREGGLWALHRLVAAGRLVPAGRPGQATLTFATQAGPLGYAVATGAGPSPFAPGLFTEFRCPVIQ